MVNLYNAEAFNADVNGTPAPEPAHFAGDIPYGYVSHEEYEKAQAEVTEKARYDQTMREARQAKLEAHRLADAAVHEEKLKAYASTDAEAMEKLDGADVKSEKARMSQADALKLLAALIGGGGVASEKGKLFSDIKAAYNAVEDFRVTGINLERTIRDSANPQRKIEVTLTIANVAVNGEDGETGEHDQFSVS